MQCVHSIMQICAHSNSNAPISALPSPLTRNSGRLPGATMQTDDGPYGTVSRNFT
jgi:hypothetical protein